MFFELYEGIETFGANSWRMRVLCGLQNCPAWRQCEEAENIHGVRWKPQTLTQRGGSEMPICAQFHAQMSLLKPSQSAFRNELKRPMRLPVQ
jgi:hypothetical protein